MDLTIRLTDIKQASARALPKNPGVNFVIIRRDTYTFFASPL